MSTATGTVITIAPRSWSLGPFKIEVQSINIVSGDTGATITAQHLSRIDAVIPCLDSVALTAQPTFTGNVATLAWTDPAASRFASVILLGK